MKRQFGITLVEVIVVVAIIGLLIQLALPAIQGSREAARRTQCASNLRQIGLAVIAHHDAIRHYPTGGWGPRCFPDSDKGRGPDQPGSWIYSTLDFIEEGSVHSIGKGKSGQAKSEAIVELCAVSVPVFVCSNRRSPRALPVDPAHKLVTNDEFKLPVPKAGRTDYAINTGDFGPAEPIEWYPRTLAETKDPNFQWYDTSKFTGISFGRSQVQMKDVADGTSKTYLVGEKYLPVSHYETGKDDGDNETMYSGFNDDSGRLASTAPFQDTQKGRHTSFGSAHPGHWQVAFCDGSVHTLTYEIDKGVHKNLANRKDGQQIPSNIH